MFPETLYTCNEVQYNVLLTAMANQKPSQYPVAMAAQFTSRKDKSGQTYMHCRETAAPTLVGMGDT